MVICELENDRLDSLTGVVVRGGQPEVWRESQSVRLGLGPEAEERLRGSVGFCGQVEVCHCCWGVVGVSGREARPGQVPGSVCVLSFLICK